MRLTKQLLTLIFLLILTSCRPAPESLSEHQHAAVGVLDAALSADAKYALISSVNFGAAYWDLEKDQLKFQWQHSSDQPSNIMLVALSPDGGRAITADKRTFSIWNTNSGQSYGYWQAPADIRDVALSKLGRYVLLGLGDGRAIHIDMKTGRRLEFTGHRNEAVASVDLSPNGLWAFTGGNDKRAILWNTKSGKPQRLFEHTTRVTQVKLSADSQHAFSSGTLGNAFIWNITTGEQASQLRLKQREYVISAAAFSNDFTKLVTGAPGRDISLWSLETGERIKQWRARTREVGKPTGAIIYAVAFSQNDDFLYSESSAGFGEIWSLNEQ